MLLDEDFGFGAWNLELGAWSLGGFWRISQAWICVGIGKKG